MVAEVVTDVVNPSMNERENMLEQGERVGGERVPRHLPEVQM